MAEVEYGGIKVGGSKLLLVIPLIGTLGGGLWAGFEFYKDYMDMKEIIQNIDTDAIAARNDVIETKLDEAIDYTRDIKSGLKDDIFKLEENIERMEDKVDESENRMKDTQASIETTLAGVRKDLNDQSKDVTSSIREVEATVRLSEKDVRNVMKETVSELENKMDRLDTRLNERLQEALDNPLSD